MAGNLVTISKNKRFRHWGFGYLFIFFIISLFGLFSLLKSVNESISSPAETVLQNPVLPQIMLVIGFSAIVLFATFQLFLLKDFKKVPVFESINIDSSVITKDCQALSAAMTELAQGNLSVQLTINAQPIPLTENAELNKFIEAFNNIIQSLKNTAAEFNKLTDIHCLRLCYVGAESFLEGRKCGQVLGEAIGGKGKVAITTGSFNASGLDLRRKGFQSYIFDNFPAIEIVNVSENKEDIELAFQHITNVINEHPDLLGVYVTEGATPGGVARAVVEAGKTEKIKIVGHDLTDETMKYVKKGIITGTLGQDPFTQGHDPVIHLFNHLVDGWRPASPRLLTKREVVTPKNYEKYWREGIGLVQSQESIERLAKPVNKKSDKHLRIAVLGREDSAFWIPVKKGVQAAAAKLSQFNVIVDWIVPEETRTKKDISAKVYGPAIESLISKKYDAFAIVSVDRKLVPYINRAVKSGIPVITANSEPTSLRSLVKIISEQSGELLESSDKLTNSAQEVNNATIQINTSMNDMAQGAVIQSNQVNHTRGTVKSLLEYICNITSQAKESALAAEETGKAFDTGSVSLEKTLDSMKSIESSVSETWHIVEELEGHSEKINDILKMINDIAFQVNLLSLNASIEAARAGEYGKGFMVVANEIRTLANNTANATKDVTNVVDLILSDIKKVNNLMEDDLKKVKSMTGLTDEVKNTFGSIQQSVKVDQNRIHEIALAISEIQQLSDEVGKAMENVADVSQRNAASVEEVSASTQTMSAQLQYVTSLANSFRSMAKSERELLAKFNLDDNNGK